MASILLYSLQCAHSQPCPKQTSCQLDVSNVHTVYTTVTRDASKPYKHPQSCLTHRLSAHVQTHNPPQQMPLPELVSHQPWFNVRWDRVQHMLAVLPCNATAGCRFSHQMRMQPGQLGCRIALLATVTVVNCTQVS